MRKIFRLLSIVLKAIVDVAEEKPRKNPMSIREAHEKFDAGMISMRECNAAYKRREII